MGVLSLHTSFLAAREIEYPFLALKEGKAKEALKIEFCGITP